MAAMKDRLSAKGLCDGKITLDGVPVGSWVTFGRRVGGRLRTVYASRIYDRAAGLSVEEEALTSRAMLSKVASALSKAAREGRWAPPSATTGAEAGTA
jgi:hypothetical protein